VTVERKIGTVALPSGRVARCVDVPGCYSLVARSQDEQIAHDAVVGALEDMPPPALAILVLDASNLQRNLYLVSQITETGLPCVLALNMMDVAERAGLEIDAKALSRELGLPVVPTVAVRELGLDALLKEVDAALGGATPRRARAWRMSEGVEAEVARMAGELRKHRVPEGRADAEAIWLLSSIQETDELVGINPHIRKQVLSVQARLEEAGTPFRVEEIEARYRWIESVTRVCVREGPRRGADWTRRLDALFTHRALGPLVFLFVMTMVFQSIFAWADPAITAIENLFGAISEGVKAVMPAGAFRDLVTEGVIAGAGNVVVFLPQILLLFFFISLLEDTGYMARAAYMMDRVMGRVGLHGRAFIPLLSSFACAIPGVMATRTIESRRDRLVTILTAPLMSCSARLPVYTLVIGALFEANRPVAGVFTVGGLVLLSMYLLSVTAAIAVAAIFKRTILKGPKPPFILEMPPYKAPRARVVARNLWERSALFLTRAGTTIMAVTIVLWGLLSYPKDVPLSRDYDVARASLAATVHDAAARDEVLSKLDAEE
ncbi:MAG: ferrous iron transport protein B, partial [Candidatus Methylomirabilis sp.]|nr:ferrous iron transport protein B [Deltaproteobacteria bacterium]